LPSSATALVLKSFCTSRYIKNDIKGGIYSYLEKKNDSHVNIYAQGKQNFFFGDIRSQREALGMGLNVS
jgi:hypothetical protein